MCYEIRENCDKFGVGHSSAVPMPFFEHSENTESKQVWHFRLHFIKWGKGQRMQPRSPFFRFLAK
jgi:hypothetical protein